jgi:hypothetical protein
LYEPEELKTAKSVKHETGQTKTSRQKSCEAFCFTKRTKKTNCSAAKCVTHRRVHEVALAGHKNAGHQRLRHQQKEAAEDGQKLRGIAHLVRAQIPEAISVLPRIYATELTEKPKSKNHPPSSLAHQ